MVLICLTLIHLQFSLTACTSLSVTMIRENELVDITVCLLFWIMPIGQNGEINFHIRDTHTVWKFDTIYSQFGQIPVVAEWLSRGVNKNFGVANKISQVRTSALFFFSDVCVW